MSEQPDTPFTIERAGTDEASFVDVFRLMLALHREGGFGVLNADKTAEGVYRALAEGMTFVARLAAGEAVGVLIMIEFPFWYSDDTFLEDRAFYVHPDFRQRPGFTGPSVGVALLHAARDEGQARNKITFITVANPDRKPKRTSMSIAGQRLGFVPIGYTIKLN